MKFIIIRNDAKHASFCILRMRVKSRKPAVFEKNLKIFSFDELISEVK